MQATFLAAIVAAGVAAGSDEAAVRQVEDEVVSAFQRNDADALDRLWADDYVFINPVGLRIDKQERLKLFRSGNFHYDSIKIEDETVRVHGTAAIVSYRSTVAAQRSGKYPTQKIAGQRWVTTVLVKEDGRWRVISQQSTPIQPRPAR